MSIVHYASRHSIAGLDNLFCKPQVYFFGRRVRWVRPAWLQRMHDAARS